MCSVFSLSLSLSPPPHLHDRISSCHFQCEHAEIYPEEIDFVLDDCQKLMSLLFSQTASLDNNNVPTFLSYIAMTDKLVE